MKALEMHKDKRDRRVPSKFNKLDSFEVIEKHKSKVNLNN